MENIITFASVTNAMKAKELVIPKRFSEAAELVRSSRIPYRGIYAADAM